MGRLPSGIGDCMNPYVGPGIAGQNCDTDPKGSAM